MSPDTRRRLIPILAVILCLVALVVFFQYQLREKEKESLIQSYGKAMGYENYSEEQRQREIDYLSDELERIK